MVSQREKKQAVQFICNLLENSDCYQVLSKTEQSIDVQETPEVRAEPHRIEVIVPNFLENVLQYSLGYASNASQEVYTAPIFYKDGKTAFVRMVDRNSSWRTDKSLKQYTLQQINQMLHLRGMEKEVLHGFKDSLSYYQPPSERLDEAVVDFSLEAVLFDYSHIPLCDERRDFILRDCFLQSNGSRKVPVKYSEDYRLPEKISQATEAAGFIYDDQALLAKLAPADKATHLAAGELDEDEPEPTEEELMAKNYYPELLPAEAVKALRGEEF